MMMWLIYEVGLIAVIVYVGGKGVSVLLYFCFVKFIFKTLLYNIS